MDIQLTNVRSRLEPILPDLKRTLCGWMDPGTCAFKLQPLPFPQLCLGHPLGTGYPPQQYYYSTSKPGFLKSATDRSQDVFRQHRGTLISITRHFWTQICLQCVLGKKKINDSICLWHGVLIFLFTLVIQDFPFKFIKF